MRGLILVRILSETRENEGHKKKRFKLSLLESEVRHNLSRWPEPRLSWSIVSKRVSGLQQALRQEGTSYKYRATDQYLIPDMTYSYHYVFRYENRRAVGMLNPMRDQK